MPRRNDIKKILLIGSGPIVIGQGCEFDYSGTQACRVLREQGYEVVLVNSNPATIMTDPETADRTYVEPITPEFVEQVIAVERPDALLPNLGGQTALNCAVALNDAGILKKYNVEVIGCNIASIRKGEDRKLFAQAMGNLGLEVARSGFAYCVADAIKVSEELGFPVVLRPSFTLGGAGGGIAYNQSELVEIVTQGLEMSPEGEVLVEESIQGWKEIEMEVMRDNAGNGIVVCSIENLDPMGVHTGDSITVAPAQTLSDFELQKLRTASIDILNEIGVETGGSNVQFAVNPDDGRIIVIEMNPRVSRSSALASKATGFPIAKAAALLSVGYTLDEITNDITGETPACFEPAIDYCVVKIPRFTFEKFKGTDVTLTTRMKAVGEVMAIGRTFTEAMSKAMRSLENGRTGLGNDGHDTFDEENFAYYVGHPTAERMYYVAEAFRRGWTLEEVHSANQIDRWFLNQLADIVRVEEYISSRKLEDIAPEAMQSIKEMGISDEQIAYLTGNNELTVRRVRKVMGVTASFKTVDTCAGEFPAQTSYYYKTYDGASDERGTLSGKPKALILSAGPNRIGQGIEFDYCCVHASFALQDDGYETIMVNCNPETVSTDYDVSDTLYFEPLTFEDVMDIVDEENPAGVVVTLGGQTPLKLAHALQEEGVTIMGTSPDSIDLAEDRERFSELLDSLDIEYPASGTAKNYDEAMEVAGRIGFPLLVRPSYVLGGRGMVIAYDKKSMRQYIEDATKITPDHPVYLDRFMEGAVEIDVDALCDGEEVYIGAILEHVEEAGIHSGDSACATPPFTLSALMLKQIADTTKRMALAVGALGVMNVQYCIKDGRLLVIEVNPRASRTVPFSSKATGVSLARAATLIMAGHKISELGLPAEDRELDHYSVKEAVMPFGRFPGADIILGPEMKSTGEVMGVSDNFPAAYAKTQLAISYAVPEGGRVFISVNDRDKRAVQGIAREFESMGFEIVSTTGTARALQAVGISAVEVRRVGEMHPNIGDMVVNNEIALIINTPLGAETRPDGYELRMDAIKHGVSCVTSMDAALAVAQGIRAHRDGQLKVRALQDL